MLRKAFVLGFLVAGVACGGDDSTGGGAGSAGQTAGSMSQGSSGSGGTAGSGGGSAGSTMAAGAAGVSAGSGGMSGSTDGGSKCSVLNQNECDTCVFGKCCDAYAACNNDDDCMLGMGNLAECVAGDPAMVDQCYDDFATTNDKASALRMCVKMSCDVPCTTQTP